MLFRFFAFALLYACAAAWLASAQLHKVFPWFHRADPAVGRHVFIRSPDFRINRKRIGILPFETGQRGEPAPPPFAPFLGQALAQRGIAGAMADFADPLRDVPQPHHLRFDREWRIARALDNSKATGVGLLALGRVDAVFRTSSGGLVIKVSAELWDVERRAPVWSGRIAVDWIRRYPIEDCMLRAAIVLVEEWESAAA